MSVPPAPPSRLAAALVDRYRLERELGQGGMATVYLAHDIKHERKVALKVLRPELAAAIGAERFLAEIRTTANLQHPHILPLFDSGHADGFLFYVMPYVEGETLRGRLCREKQLAIGAAVRIATEVAGALDYAHRHGVIHRDIKPENILMLDGAALVADFGIALAVTRAGAGNRITEAGMSVGTPQYMAPEQAMGERDITGRADIYALGAVTYEMLLGDPPFTGSTTQAIVARVMTEAPRPLISQRKTIPPELEDAVLRALEKLPADRFETAAEFAQAMALDPGGRQSGGAGFSSGRRSNAQRPRSAARSFGRAALVLLLAGALPAAVFLGRRLAPSRVPLVAFGRAIKVTWDRGLEIHPALSPDGRYVAYATGTTADLRIFVRQVAGGRATPLTGGSPDVQSNPSWSPDGTRILFLSKGGVFSAPSSGGAARPEVPSSASGLILSAAWSPDGATIAYSIGDSLYTRGGDGRVRPTARIYDPSLCQWSPDARLIACTSGNSYYSRAGLFIGNLSPSRIVVVRVADGVTTTITDSTSINQSPVWSRDGQWLYFVSSRLGPRDVYALRISRDGGAEGEPVRLTTGLNAQTMSMSADGSRFAYAVFTTTANVWSLPFPPHGATMAGATQVTFGNQIIERAWPSADGKWLFFDSDVSGNSDIYRMALPNGEPEPVVADPSDDFWPELSPDGRELAFHSWRSGSRDIYVMPMDGGPVQHVTSSSGQEAAPSWSPDGRALTFDEFGVPGGIWVVRRDSSGVWGRPSKRYPAGGWAVWSPDGRWIAFTSYFLGGSLMIVPPDSGAPRVVLNSATSSGVYAEQMRWSADSRTLYFKSHDPRGNASIWEIPITGGTPKLLLRVDDPARPSYRPEWVVGAGRMYFTIQDRQSDVWVMDVTGAGR